MSKIITIFGSSRDVENSPEYNFAFELGKQLGKNKYSICNGGYGGTMEATAKGAYESGTETIGVIVDIFGPTANRYIKKTIVVHSLFERLQELIKRGDGYIVLKGGTGTLLEIAAVWELINKGLIQSKPIIAVSPFWDPIVNQFKEEMAWEGRGDCTKHVRLAKSPDEIIAVLNKLL